MTKHWGTDQDLPNIPKWVPNYAVRYLAHTEQGVSIRALARHSNCHASTVLRQIRRVESRRDDPLIDEALSALGAQVSQSAAADRLMETFEMNAQNSGEPPSEKDLRNAAGKILLRLNEAGAVLAVAKDMEKAVVVRDTPGAAPQRMAVVDRPIAQAMALKDWISCKTPGRISRYQITAAGRTELGRLTAGKAGELAGFNEAQAAFDAGTPVDGAGAGVVPRRMRFSAGESPMSILARRKDKSGKPFLSSDLVAAGERMREDFELSQMEAAVGQNWDRFLTAGVSNGDTDRSGGFGPMAARRRVGEAVEALGEGLSDVVLRCCCYLEGLESAEKRLGWPARSGKVVLRIALIRLREHYEASRSETSDMIG
ncbi:DUF6456 domain-containing protein [Cognatishimia sp. WU-CL00825]|uniref:DUF6456 domain-containing protein n=1 Tax=Cognatishimia sp. WU-CL00825 TaxID=3127658 RepID=UPI003105FCF7